MPSKPKVENENLDTMLLNHPDPRQPINNVYKLPITEHFIKYLHACDGFQTKEIWIKTTRLGNYTTWLQLTIKATNKYFPEVEETQKGDMQQKIQRARSTKYNTQVLQPEADGKTINVTPKKHDNIYVELTRMKNTIYTSQNGKLPVTSRRGNKYLMIMCEICINGILSEPMKTITEN